MKIAIDTLANTFSIEDGGTTREVGLYSAESFAELSRMWVKVGWAQRYSYSFTWLGRPVIQLPEDLIRVQEAIYLTRPDVIVETGVAHGGSLIFYASVLKAIGQGRVLGIDIEIKSENRSAIEDHDLAPFIGLIEGSSTSHEVLASVRQEVSSADRTMVILDSNHSRDHVLKELELYSEFVSPGSYIVATDGIMGDLADVPGGDPIWRDDNPASAASAFAAKHPSFALVDPPRIFDEGAVTATPTYWPGAWLQRSLA